MQKVKEEIFDRCGIIVKIETVFILFYMIILIGAFLALLLVFYWLAKVCDQYFVHSLETITEKLEISEDVSGASFMAIGSSAPELFTAIIALSKVGIENVGAGTIVGSAIFNVLMIIGVSAIVKEIVLEKVSVIRDISIYFVSLVLLIFTFWDGVITFKESLIYIIAYAGYLLLLSQWKRWFPVPKHVVSMEYLEKIQPENQQKNNFFHRFDNKNTAFISYLFPKSNQYYKTIFVLSILYIIALSWVMVELGVFIAHSFGIPQAIIALTVLAAGTSVPDMISSVIATKKGYGNMAMSNAIGSNSFDILIGLGLPWFIYILWKGQNVEVGTENLLSSILLLFGTVVLLSLILIGKKFSLSRTEGGILVGVYGLYILLSILHVSDPTLLPSLITYIPILGQ